MSSRNLASGFLARRVAIGVISIYLIGTPPVAMSSAAQPGPAASTRLYVLDCGYLINLSPETSW
jgi:hypothetical protein